VLAAQMPQEVFVVLKEHLPPVVVPAQIGTDGKQVLRSAQMPQETQETFSYRIHKVYT
jgi:predicted Rdx family selenoprotein